MCILRYKQPKQFLWGVVLFCLFCLSAESLLLLSLIALVTSSSEEIRVIGSCRDKATLRPTSVLKHLALFIFFLGIFLAARSVHTNNGVNNTAIYPSQRITNAVLFFMLYCSTSEYCLQTVRVPCTFNLLVFNFMQRFIICLV